MHSMYFLGTSQREGTSLVGASKLLEPRMSEIQTALSIVMLSRVPQVPHVASFNSLNSSKIINSKIPKLCVTIGKEMKGSFLRNLNPFSFLVPLFLFPSWIKFVLKDVLINPSSVS